MHLSETLQTKSAQFKGRADLKQLFLVNNLSHMASSIRHNFESDKELGELIIANILPTIESSRDGAFKVFVKAR